MTVVTKAEFARIIGVGRSMVGKYCRNGLPQRADGRLYLEAARAWVAANVDRDSYRARSDSVQASDHPQRKRTLADERTRLAKAQADAQEIRNQKFRGELIPANEIVEAWQASISRARSLLLGLPAGMAEQAVMLVRREPDDTKAVHAVREHLTDEIYAALEELANTNVEDDDDEDGEQSAA
jgi:phage terminase Nu1 subunit (DNA packaging protein)